MLGIYLYGIRKGAASGPTMPMVGIDGKGGVYTLLFRDLEAIVSQVSLEDFASEEIQRKAQEDLKWIKEKAVGHENVVEKAMRGGNHILSLIPMRFGTIFKDEERLIETLNNGYLNINRMLEALQGKQEWSVKVYLKDRETFEQSVKERNEAIKKKEREIASLPEGIAFFMEEEFKELILKEVHKKLNIVTQDLFERLKKQGVASVKCKILAKELTGRKEPMVLNAAYLVLQENINGFQQEAMDLNQKWQPRGLSLEYSGPWPPYNFNSLDNF